MEIVKILGVDASLRNTGLAIVSYNTEMSINNPEAFKVSHAQVLVNQQKFTGTDAIMNMLDMINDESKKAYYFETDTVIVESPPIMFNKKFSSSVISSIAHVSGGAVALFGIEKSYLIQPIQWNKRRKKEVTHHETTSFLGDADKWHYEKRVKSEKFMEHILDAASMALWYIRTNYVEE